VSSDDMRGEKKEVRVGAKHHPPDCVGAQIFLSVLAIETNSAWSGRRGHDLVSGFEAGHAGAGLDDDAGKLMPESDRQFPQWMPAAKSFEIGAAAQRAADSD